MCVCVCVCVFVCVCLFVCVCVCVCVYIQLLFWLERVQFSENRYMFIWMDGHRTDGRTFLYNDYF